jgi:hypothetical protein
MAAEPTGFEAYTAGQLLDAARELGRRNAERDKRRQDEEYARHKALRAKAFEPVQNELVKQYPQLEGLSADDLEEIWFAVDDFKEKWDR